MNELTWRIIEAGFWLLVGYLLRSLWKNRKSLLNLS